MTIPTVGSYLELSALLCKLISSRKHLGWTPPFGLTLPSDGESPADAAKKLADGLMEFGERVLLFEGDSDEVPAPIDAGLIIVVIITNARPNIRFLRAIYHVSTEKLSQQIVFVQQEKALPAPIFNRLIHLPTVA